ncbi:MAG TPA: M36 family metallopeptidase [Kofleriaceae bacterium]|nr:M36 family metallopeptidase [Kofleriaceae bacterium]
MGVSVVASAPTGAPSLVRAIAPRPSPAGMTAVAAAQAHVAALAPLWVGQAPAMALADNGSQALRNGATLVKLVQHVNGVPVNHGELHVLLHTDGSLAAVSGTLLPAMASAPGFASTSSAALGHALDQHFGAKHPAMTVTAGKPGDAGWEALQVASSGAQSVSSARARRTMAQVGNQLVAAWEVEVEGDGAPDAKADPSIPTYAAHSYLVADATGQILDDVDLVQRDAFVYRAYMETTGNRRPLDGPLAGFSPHPTGVPDGSKATLVPANLVVQDSFNGPLDPWLPSNATTTSGNNAEAFADLDANRVFNGADVRPIVKSGRVLNYIYDHTAEPLATPEQSEAAAVNSFFVVNWMHDWYYDSGFTEATGNAQADNLGRGGVANDPLLVTAQAGANAGLRNNADMATPADGARPRMRMFLWTAGTLTGLNGPGGTPHTEAFVAGPRNFDLTGELVAVTDNTAPFDDGCETITNGAALAGKIALVTFSGTCGSLATVNNVAAAGAIGIVLADGGFDDPRAFAGSAAANIPGLAIGKAAEQPLLAALAAGPVTIEITSQIAGVERDGDLDNGVVSHEWGHYLHHRLAVCGGAGSQQCAGMSEGWGDFNALMMLAHEGDNRNGVYAEGLYALEDGVTPDVGYFGIRRFPYSRDRTKNDLSFRHIGDENALPTATPGHPGGVNSEVHNAGEIWASMMWEAFNVVADAHGVDVARRRMADYVVAGLLLAPRNATFTEQRDAILIGASALDSDDMLLMAGAFAGRGIGSCAASPDRASVNNAGVVESGTLAARLAVGGLTVTDDGKLGDHDGILDPGESGTLRLTLANSGVIAAENVVVTATSANTGVKLGAPLKIAAQPLFSSSTLSIPVQLATSAPVNTKITINVHVAAQQTCSKAGIDASLTVITGANPVAAPPASELAERASRVESMVQAPATSLGSLDATCVATE